MKIWTNNDFKGIYPVGTAAVVIAETREKAKEYLDPQLKAKRLPKSNVEDFHEMDFMIGGVRILCDGNY